MKLRAVFVFSMVLALNAVAQSQPWLEKPHDQWTQKDVDKILLHSPWVQEVEVMAAGPSREGALATQNGTAMIDPATQQPIVGAVATMSHRKFVIRWMSSVVLRQSMVRQMQLKGLLNQNSGSGPSQPLDSYRIMLSGSPDQYAGLTENVLQQSTYLETAPTGQKIFPTSVVISPASIDFSFPREMEGKPTIPDKQTRAKFHCKLKTATVHADFDLRKMVYQGHPDL